MSLAAIPEEIPCRFGEIDPVDAKSPATQPADQPVTMSIKHTFIELAVPPSRGTQRIRSFTDSELLNGGEVREHDASLPEISDASTDAPSDIEEIDQAHRFAEWKSPCLDAQKFAEFKSPSWGPAGDLYYSPALGDNGFPLLPQTEFYTPDEYAAWAAAGGMTGLPDEAAAWMLPWAAPFDPSQFDAAAWAMFEAEANAAMDPSMLGVEKSSAANAGSSEEVASSSVYQPADAPMTTIMLRNLPDHFTRSHVIELLEDEGFEGSYDLVYAPMDFGCKCCLGYAFVNFLAASDAARCWSVFDGFSEWGTACDKLCEVMWSQPHQGVEVLIERYRNSPVMHESVPDEWKPAYFVDGIQVDFPIPTKKIKAPQMKARNKKSKGDL